jgi:anaerobic selenocysteine-containing dehydrogenase
VARLVVIDPYRSRTAAKADLHVQLYPGTDGALVMGLLHVILRDGLEDTEYLAQYTTGLAEFCSQIEDWTPARAAQETGVPPAQIVALAHEYATTHPACIRHGIGLQRATGAGMALRLIQCLPVATGQWRYAAGGIAGPQSAGMLYGDRLSRPDLGPPVPRTLNMIQLGRHLTDPALQPPIAALYVFNANPAVIAPEQDRVLQGLRREDLFTVVHEQFMTDTARYADIILPATTMLEQEDLLGSWGFNYVALSKRAIAPQGEAKSNTEVARLLAARFGFADDLFRLSDTGISRDPWLRSRRASSRSCPICGWTFPDTQRDIRIRLAWSGQGRLWPVPNLHPSRRESADSCRSRPTLSAAPPHLEAPLVDQFVLREPACVVTGRTRTLRGTASGRCRGAWHL